ncbi:eukaryotic translation initiation factor 1A protein [Rutstroemia sp. NJR-2017a BVV2]|nr:eukaryotic translation initiation factor 1A protein [Rutstroemia sp. NJR-2017a BVV2]
MMAWWGDMWAENPELSFPLGLRAHGMDSGPFSVDRTAALACAWLIILKESPDPPVLDVIGALPGGFRTDYAEWHNYVFCLTDIESITSRENGAFCVAQTQKLPYKLQQNELISIWQKVNKEANMPKNKGKGGKNRRRGKNENDNEKRELVFKEEGQGTYHPTPISTTPHSLPPLTPNPEYAQVLKMLGNGRLEALCFDGSKRLAHIRGKLRKKVWINQGDIILLSLRDYQDEKGDVILKYSSDEARALKAYRELPDTAKINETDTYGPGDDNDPCNFDFAEDDSDSEEEEADGAKPGKEIDIDDI